MDYTDLKPGVAFMFEGNPYIVISSEFHRMQMRKAVMRTTMKNLFTNQLIQKTFTASERFEPADVEKVDVKYLYRDSDSYYFMDKNTFEQYHASREILGDKVKFLSDDLDLGVVLYNNNPVQLILPKYVTLRVVEAPDAVKGDSVSNTFKTVTCENDIKVVCPLFIKKGDLLKIDTENGNYLERAK